MEANGQVRRKESNKMQRCLQSYHTVLIINPDIFGEEFQHDVH